MLLVALAWACSPEESDDESASQNEQDPAGGSSCDVDFAAPSELRLDQLSQEQAVDICYEYGAVLACAYPEPVICRIEGIAAARAAGSDDPEVCRMVEAECLQDGSKSMEETSQCPETDVPQDCAATVSDLEQCWQQTVEFAESQSHDWSCDDVAAYFTWAESVQDITSEACERVASCN